MPQRPITTRGTVGFLRTVHALLLLSMGFYAAFMRNFPAKSVQPLDTRFLLWFGVIGVVNLAIAQVFRSKRVRPALEALRMKPDDGQSLVQWRKAAIVCGCLAESVFLLGFVIGVMGGSIWQVAPFFIAGVAAMLLWWPTAP